MEIETIMAPRFGKNVKGIILDNAYDVYKRNRFIEYVKDRQISYIYCRDVDLRLLSWFSQVEYLTVPEEAEHLENLQCLSELKGLEITAQCLSHVDLGWFPQLDRLVVHGQPHQAIICDGINYLYCSQWSMKDFRNLIGVRKVKSLCLDFCSKLESLQGVENFSGLQEIALDYCTRLTDIEALAAQAESLKSLSVTDCNRIRSLQVLSQLINLETLSLTNFQSGGRGKLPSVAFLDALPRLQEFMTDYRILDNDLTPLLNLKNVSILCHNKKYNLPQEALPHESD